MTLRIGSNAMAHGFTVQSFILCYTYWNLQRSELHDENMFEVLFFNNITILRALLSIFRKNTFYLDDFFPFIVPVIMYIFGGDKTVGDVLKWWFIIIAIGGFAFSVIGLNAGHHHPETVHDGDKLR